MRDYTFHALDADDVLVRHRVPARSLQEARSIFSCDFPDHKVGIITFSPTEAEQLLYKNRPNLVPHSF